VLLLTLKVTFRLPFQQLEGFVASVFALMGNKFIQIATPKSVKIA